MTIWSLFMQPILETSAGLLLTYFLVAFFVGGIQGARKDAGQPVKAVLVYAASCGISGLLVGLACLEWIGAGRPYLSLLLVILGGWIGPALVDFAAGVVQARLQAKVTAAALPPIDPAKPPVEKESP
jgi:hypothetical protein